MELKHPDDACSTLLGARVVGVDGSQLGRVCDVLVVDDGGAPTTTSLLVRRRGWRRRSIELPWSAVMALDNGTITAAAPRHVEP